MHRDATINSTMELLLVKLHTQDQSNKELVNDTINWVFEFSVSSNVQWLHSLHNVHIKHNVTKFQISNEYLPNQFRQPNKRSTTFLNNTHWIAKDLKAKHHNSKCNKAV